MLEDELLKLAISQHEIEKNTRMGQENTRGFIDGFKFCLRLVGNVDVCSLVKQLDKKGGDTPIQKLNMTDVVRNPLMRYGLTNAGQISKFSIDELKCFKRIGKKAIDEIEQALHEVGLKLVENNPSLNANEILESTRKKIRENRESK